MANSIALAKAYTNLLDEVYKTASVTNDLTSDASLVRAGANANEILYPQIDVSGLGDYDRNSGYTDGSVSVVWRTATFNYDRGTKISVDSMDDEETFGIAFGQAASELMRTKVAPEADAFTFATLAGVEGISTTTGTYADASEFLAALIAAKNQMDEDEVPEENRILYATPTLINGVMGLDTTKSREILNTFAAVKKVPQSRFYTAIDLLDGKTSGEEAGHYQKADTGANINFMIIHKPCLMKWDKHAVSSIIAPDNNPDSDSYIVKYRKYGIVDVLANKVAGIYLSYQA
ncbi:MAG: hypothetical protein LIO78_08315 [Clostridiales bacterium]|nr:hypothetical protein [Clostridiales bacterium]MCC8100046.1 hypothetical protein [Clostridiales bacterium]